MKVAIPLANGKLAMHFGHCERFALIDVDTAEKKIIEPGGYRGASASAGAAAPLVGGTRRDDDHRRRHGAARPGAVRRTGHSGGARGGS